MSRMLSATCLISIVAAAATYGLRSYSGKDQASESAASQSHLLEFSSTTIDAGSCTDDGESQQFAFSFHNTTPEPVVIESVSAGCACTIARCDSNIPAGVTSAIAVVVAPRIHKRFYSVTVHAKQGELRQAEVLTVNLEVTEQGNLVLDPRAIYLGELTVLAPFSMERELRIVNHQGNPVLPQSLSGPPWLKIDTEIRESSVLLRLSGWAPDKSQEERGRIKLTLPLPYAEQSVPLSYSIRPKYLVKPSCLFGSVRSDQQSARSVEIVGLHGEDKVAFSVVMQSGGSVEILPGSLPGHFLISPQFHDDSLEVSGTVTWTINSASDLNLGNCKCRFLFLKQSSARSD